MTVRTLCLAVVAVSLLACVKQVPATPTRSGPPRPVQLLAETPERETSQIEEKREDVEIDTRDFERTPRVVAKGETPLLRLEGSRARLYGDAAGKEGFSVDNLILLEVLDEKGQVLNRGAVGFTDFVRVRREPVDNVGPMSFNFEPGVVDLTHLLPESAPFKVRATVLDYSGVGRVSNVFLLLEPRERGSEDDLRNQ
ncbi:hypothetical protein [Hyalangium sp.]|uniref:hypothetical protein n=1 Tax=Hyalangium sp. TaxID=2028555 RepID=UPI002D6364B4|nr:hypothetical protein [Hyalangium sp.]HYH99404.1 hypothetical protein [Hyalangium sp.]